MFNNKKGLCHDSFNRSNHALMRMRQRNVNDTAIEHCLDWGSINTGKLGRCLIRDRKTTVVIDPNSQKVITVWRTPVSSKKHQYKNIEVLRTNNALRKRSLRRSNRKELQVFSREILSI